MKRRTSIATLAPHMRQLDRGTTQAWVVFTVKPETRSGTSGCLPDAGGKVLQSDCLTRAALEFPRWWRGIASSPMIISIRMRVAETRRRANAHQIHRRARRLGATSSGDKGEERQLRAQIAALGMPSSTTLYRKCTRR